MRLYSGGDGVNVVVIWIPAFFTLTRILAERLVIQWFMNHDSNILMYKSGLNPYALEVTSSNRATDIDRIRRAYTSPLHLLTVYSLDNLSEVILSDFSASV